MADGDGWLIKGSTDLHALQQAVGLDDIVDEDEDIATVAGLVIAVNGHIPRTGDVVERAPLQFTVLEANDYRVDLVRVVKTVHDSRKKNNPPGRQTGRSVSAGGRPVLYPPSPRPDVGRPATVESLPPALAWRSEILQDINAVAPQIFVLPLSLHAFCHRHNIQPVRQRNNDIRYRGIDAVDADSAGKGFINLQHVRP